VPATPGDGALPASIEIGAVVRRTGPRLARDGFGPLAVFFTGWKPIGLGAGMGFAVLFGAAVFARPGGPVIAEAEASARGLRLGR
jgi:hypothetical protein